jgi:putative transposase
VLREAESGDPVVEVCRKHGVSQQIFYLWKKKYAGLGLSELRELRQLRDENSKLKRLADSRWNRVLTVVDQFTRECLALCAERP